MKTGIVPIILAVFCCSNVFADANGDMFTACLACDLNGVKKAIDSGADVNALNAEGQNALTSAFFCPDVTAFLLEKGCDPNGGSYPAIIQACNNYSIEVIQLLLDAGADPNKPGLLDPGAHLRKLIADEKAKGKKANKTLITAWESALAMQKSSEVSALQQTVQQTNCVPCLKMILEKGADVKRKIGSGTILHTLSAFSMTREGRKDAFAKGVPAMQSYGFKLPEWYGNLPDNVNGTSPEMLDLLVAHGADVNQANEEGYSPLIVALRTFKLDLSKAYINNGADVKTGSGVSLAGKEMEYVPICAAAEFGDVELMKLMLENGADINATTTTNALTKLAEYRGNASWGGDGFTPLIISIMYGKTDVAHYLLGKGSDIRIGSSGISILNTKFAMLFCLVKTTKKIPIYWAVEQEDLSLVEAIAEKMEWRFNPDFTIKQYSAGGLNAGTYIIKCANFKAKQSPSSYASEVGNKEAARLLAAKGL